MTTKELIDYVEGELKKGEQKDAIKARLLQNGWSNNDIEETFRIVENKIVETENISASAPAHTVSSPTSISFWDFIHKKTYKNYKERIYDFMLGLLAIIALWFILVFPSTALMPPGTHFDKIAYPVYFGADGILFLYLLFKRKYIAIGLLISLLLFDFFLTSQIIGRFVSLVYETKTQLEIRGQGEFLYQPLIKEKIVEGKELIADAQNLGLNSFAWYMFVSPNKMNLANIGHARLTDKAILLINGKKAGTHDYIVGVYFSPDSKNFAYKARDNTRDFNNDFIVFNGQESERYLTLENSVIYWSADGRHITYRGVKAYGVEYGGGHSWPAEREYSIVVDNKEIKKSKKVIHPLTSEDKTTVAYLIEENGIIFFPFENREVKIEKFGGEVDSRTFNSFVLSPDGKNFAYIIKSPDDKKFLVSNNIEISKDYYNIEGVTFNPDGKNIVYKAWKDSYTSPFAVINGKEGKAYNSIYGFNFSPDGRHLAYIAEDRGDDRHNKFIVVDGKEERKYNVDLKGGLLFDSNSEKLTFVANSDKKDKNFVVIYDMIFNRIKTGKEYGEIGILSFSPDGKRLTYVAADDRLDGPYFLVIDDREGRKYPLIQGDGGRLHPSLSNIQFSPDSKNVLYQVSVESQSIPGSDDRIIVVNGEEEKERYDTIKGPFFLDNNTIRYFINDYKTNRIYKITEVVK